MSTPLFLLAALPVGALIFVLGWVLGRLLDPLVGFDARRARLHRRRTARIARGTDLYFEELRSINASLAQVEAQAAAPRQNWLAPPLALLAPFLALFIGVFVLGLLAPVLGMGEPPAWTQSLMPAIFLLVGLRHLVDPATTYMSTRGARVLGLTYLGLSLALLALKFI